MKQVGISLLGVMSLVTVANASQGTLSHEEIVNKVTNTEVMPSKLHMSAAAPAKGDYVTLSSKNLLVVAVFPPRISTGHCPDGKAPSSGSCIRVMTTGAFLTNGSGSGAHPTAVQTCAIVAGALSIPTMRSANGDDINSERSTSAAFPNWFANGGNNFHRTQWQRDYNNPSNIPNPEVFDVWTNHLYAAGTPGFVYCFADVAY